MNKVLGLLLFSTLCVFTFNSVSAQVHLKVETMAGFTDKYGVYAKICEDAAPSSNTITGSGQVTLKFPIGKTFTALTSVAGVWQSIPLVVGPSEAPDKVYVSVGFQQDVPHILYQADVETLLFTFKLTGNTAGSPELIVNGVDPFDHLPNSMSSNPGNELTILDFGVQPLGLYTYAGNYVGSSVNCTDVPQDTTVITPPGDTSTQDTTIITPPGDTSTQDTTIVTPPGDTSTQDTTIITPPGDTSTQDTTIITPPGDTTQQTSGVRNLVKQANQFTLYPTPTFEWITVRFLDPAIEEGTVRLFTLNGVPIGEIKRGQRPELTLNVSGLSAGLYLIRYEKDGKTLQQDKFLKQ